MFHVIQMICVFFLLVKFLWDVEENRAAVLRFNRFLSQKFNFKLIDWADTNDLYDDDDDSASEAEAEAESEAEESTTTLRRRIVECDGGEDTTNALEKATRELQQSVKKTLTTTTS